MNELDASRILRFCEIHSVKKPIHYFHSFSIRNQDNEENDEGLCRISWFIISTFSGAHSSIKSIQKMKKVLLRLTFLRKKMVGLRMIFKSDHFTLFQGKPTRLLTCNYKIAHAYYFFNEIEDISTRIKIEDACVGSEPEIN
mmetsp:Transcript_19588/g.24710  ORF Transcript_19588/g.24710 Transcript_19588/m.24710 type:complete len:141 (+) Transcript_19588:772-1194(+)